MMKMTFAVGAVLAFAAAAGTSAANAAGMHMNNGSSMHSMNMHSSGMSMPDHMYHHHPRFGVIIANTGSGCGYLYDRWIYSGDYFWKRKYEACRFGW
jgi:hypothetical protein